MPDSPACVAEKILQLAPRLVLLDDAIADVRPIEARDELLRRIEREPLDDLAPRRRIGRRGQRDARHVAESARAAR